MEKNIITQTFFRNLGDKIIITVLCIAFYTLHIGFDSNSDVTTHVTYNFNHVNVFHLIVNLMVLWQIKNKIDISGALLVAFVASYLPMYVTEPTMGLSGFLFAAFGIMWGKTGEFKKAMKAGLPFIIITMLLPNVNGLLHLYCYLIGYVIGTIYNRLFNDDLVIS